MSNPQLLEAVELIHREKDIDKSIIFYGIEQALAKAYENSENNLIDVETIIDVETGSIEYYQLKEVVDEVYDENTEISIDEMREYDENAELGDHAKIGLPDKDLSRIAMHTVKQLLFKKIREEENAIIYNKYKDKKGCLLAGTVRRIVGNKVYLGMMDKIEAILGVRDQIKTERYERGKNKKFYVVDVLKMGKGRYQTGPILIGTRSRPEFVKKLFELEVPEVFEKVIEIVNVAREPGLRCKIAVLSNDSKVDPVGTCVGANGNKIQTIVNELNGERIDVIPYDDMAEVFIKNSLKPAAIESVTLNVEEKAAIVVVPKEQYSLAIGRNGQNVRLAVKLTGWKIDIKTENMMSNEDAIIEAESLFMEQGERVIDIEIPGVGEKTKAALIEAGFDSIKKLKISTPEEISKVETIGIKTAEKILQYLNEEK